MEEVQQGTLLEDQKWKVLVDCRSGASVAGTQAAVVDYRLVVLGL